MTVTEIINYIPPKKVIPKTANPKLSTMLKAIDSKEGDYRIFILADVNNIEELELIANQAVYHDFRMLAVTKLALRKLKSVNWIKTKPRKLAKLTRQALNIAEPIFQTWYREILLKVLSDSQLEYLSRKAPVEYRQDIDQERKTRGIEIFHTGGMVSL